MSNLIPTLAIGPLGTTEIAIIVVLLGIVALIIYAVLK